MREAYWGYAVIFLGIVVVMAMWFMANVTRTDQNNYNLLKETVEAAMTDAIDIGEYRPDGSIKMSEKKFVENFIRRFAQNADLSNDYKIEIYDISEEPPKVSLKVSSKKTSSTTGDDGQLIEFDVINHIDAILETKY